MRWTCGKTGKKMLHFTTLVSRVSISHFFFLYFIPFQFAECHRSSCAVGNTNNIFLCCFRLSIFCSGRWKLVPALNRMRRDGRDVMKKMLLLAIAQCALVTCVVQPNETWWHLRLETSIQSSSGRENQNYEHFYQLDLIRHFFLHSFTPPIY